MNCFRGVWKEEHLRRPGPEREECVIGSVDGGEERPDSVHLRDVAGEDRQDICGQRRSQTELDWPDEERRLLVECIHHRGRSVSGEPLSINKYSLNT